MSEGAGAQSEHRRPEVRGVARLHVDQVAPCRCRRAPPGNRTARRRRTRATRAPRRRRLTRTAAEQHPHPELHRGPFALDLDGSASFCRNRTASHASSSASGAGSSQRAGAKCSVAGPPVRTAPDTARRQGAGPESGQRAGHGRGECGEFDHAPVGKRRKGEAKFHGAARPAHDFIRSPAGSICTGDTTRRGVSPARSGSRATIRVPSPSRRASSASPTHSPSAGL